MKPDGLEAVLLLSRPALLRFLRARGAGDDAEDMLQELWLKAARGGHPPIAAPLPYLYRMADNLMLDRRRSLVRAMRRDRSWSDDESLRPASAPSVERAVAARQQLGLTALALESLGERTAAIFRRFRLDGVGQREIAIENGISLSAVEKHLQRAYRAMLDTQRRLDAEPERLHRPDCEGSGDAES